MKKHTIGRAAGFVGAAVLTAGLVGVGVGLTGAYFQDTETGQVTASTGEVDVTANTPMSSSFGPLMPGTPDSNTYSFKNEGTGPVDLYLGSANWQLGSNFPGAGNPGTTLSNGVITLNSTAAPTSYEWPDLSVPLTGGVTTIGFQWQSADVTCAGGVPRLFVQGGAYNTFDIDPAGPLACGSTPDANGWRTVSQTVPANINGEAGYVGIVNDATASDPGTILVRNVVIGAANLSSPATQNFCSVPNSNLFQVRVNSETHDTGFNELCNLPTGSAPILFATNVQVGQTRNVDVTLLLGAAAGNDLANKFGTSDLVVIATQAGQAPTAQADQVGNDS
jgi:hypothetical protein